MPSVKREYTCRHTYAAVNEFPEETREWTASYELIDFDSCHMEIIFRGRGSRIYAVIGQTLNGTYYICLPDEDAGGSLARLNRVDWNYEKLNRLLNNETDACTIAAGIKEISDYFSKVSDGGFDRFAAGNKISL